MAILGGRTQSGRAMGLGVGSWNEDLDAVNMAVGGGDAKGQGLAALKVGAVGEESGDPWTIA